jgi:manganese/iron transport system substrate-binding protein
MRRRVLAALALAVIPWACTQTTTPGPHRLRVVATFSTLGALAKAVAGPDATVSVLVPIGASPEDYQPTPGDIRTLHDADVLIENGAGIEAWLDRTVANAKNPAMRTIVLSDGMPIKNGNPHLWMDPVYAQEYAAKIADALAAADPGHRSRYVARGRAFAMELAALRRTIAQRIATIPKDQRTMIVFHNAWQYYNDRFGIRTLGVIELSPGQEPSPRYIGDLVRLAKTHHVRAVFAEPEYSPKLVQALAQSAGIATVENLYDDSLSTSPAVHDYPSMLRYDTDTIVRALR